MKKLFLLLLLAPWALRAQNCQLLSYESMTQLRQHVNYLASDELMGRKPGTKGAIMARNYIANEFKKADLIPWLEKGYYQQFQVPRAVEVNKAQTLLIVNGANLLLNEVFYPVKYSANASAEGETEYVSYGIESDEPDRDDINDRKVEGAIAVMEIGSPDGIHPHSEFLAYHDLYARIENLQKKGARAVILVDTEEQTKDPAATYNKLNAAQIPVVFVADAQLAKSLRSGAKVKMAVEQKAKTSEAFNVLGYLNNNAERTVVIGAHYDHLGLGGESSLYRTEEPEIHNGADDNASGTAALIELAHFLNSSDSAQLRRVNYLFIAFSGEEMGLLGSNYFVKNPGRQIDFLYMLNMDMVGRMEESKLQVNGTGTSPAWEEVLESIECNVEMVFSESGVGPSDHSSFYYQKVPALHFFTGTHTDYHKPTDDAEKINYKGLVQVMNIMLNIMVRTPQEMEFTETKNQSMSAPRFSVTLGVLPDYLYSGKGMRIDGVTQGRPADKAGLKAGDVVTRLGQTTVSDMMSYMQALAQFKEGDKTEIEYKREGETQTSTIQF